MQYNSVLEITQEAAKSITKKELKAVSEKELCAIDDRFKAEGKSVGIAGVAKNAFKNEAKEAVSGMALGCLNLMLPFAALGYFKKGKKKTAIAQLVICDGALIGLGLTSGWVVGLIACYVLGAVYSFVMSKVLGFISDAKEAISDAKEATRSIKGALSFNNVFTAHLALTEVEHFKTPADHKEYVDLLKEREAHVNMLLKAMK